MFWMLRWMLRNLWVSCDRCVCVCVHPCLDRTRATFGLARACAFFRARAICYMRLTFAFVDSICKEKPLPFIIGLDSQILFLWSPAIGWEYSPVSSLDHV